MRDEVTEKIERPPRALQKAPSSLGYKDSTYSRASLWRASAAKFRGTKQQQIPLSLSDAQARALRPARSG